jgi:hypothetical protein
MSDIRFNTWLHRTGSGGVYQDAAGNVGIGTSVPTSALSVVGVVSATEFVGDLSGNVTGQILGVQTSIVVGDKFINSSGVGLGTTSTTGRNAGVGTATGTLIFNSTTGLLEYYNGTIWLGLQRNFDATGGTITFANGKKIHTFTGSGTFQVNVGSIEVDYLVVAGGGGGGVDNFTPLRFGSGGGAGGLRTNLPGVVDAASSPLTGSPFFVSPGSYTVTVGAGGAGGVAVAFQVAGLQGSPSSFDIITSTGGGGAAGHNPGPTGPIAAPGTTGGSGGGGQPGTREGNTPPTSPPQGNPGGVSDAFSGSGGGGAGARGFNAPSTGTGNPGPSEPGAGGIGVRFTQIPTSIGTPGPQPGTYFAGGGGGAPQNAAGGSGGGGPGNGTSGTTNTGGGGGGHRLATAGSGGSGIVIIAYPS